MYLSLINSKAIFSGTLLNDASLRGPNLSSTSFPFLPAFFIRASLS
jgi:hypothetical protein